MTAPSPSQDQDPDSTGWGRDSKGWSSEEQGVEDEVLLVAAREVVGGGVGREVRSIPHRRTLEHEAADGRAIFCKLRDRRPGDALNEWRWLHELPRLGFRAPQPILLARDGNRTAVCTLGVPGRPVRDLIAEAVEAGRQATVEAWVVSAVAPMLRRFHGQGLVFRDLYWNHLYIESLDEPGREPTFIDVERIFRPRWRWRRWLVKDLAGLFASLPPGVPQSILMPGFRAYAGESGAASLLGPVTRKAARIRAHRPRYG